ncbi:MAG: anti-sigma factor family protein [Candidatus Brachytrichaceae bacterium NZ_4S206]|jgi:anti-sigma factor RsiW
MIEDELISAYVDGRMSEAERAAFDARMAQDPVLRRRVAATRLLVREARALHSVQPPRNFILPLDAGRKQPAPEPRRSSFSPWVFRLGSLATTVIFVSLVAFEVLRPAPFAAAPAAVPAAAPAAEVSPQRELPAPAPAQPAFEMAPMGVVTGTAVLSVTPMQSEALPADQIQAAAAPEADAESAGADAAQPSSRALSEPSATIVAPTPAPQPPAPLASGPVITPARLLAALALLAAIVLGLLGWVKR